MSDEKVINWEDRALGRLYHIRKNTIFAHNRHQIATNYHKEMAKKMNYGILSVNCIGGMAVIGLLINYVRASSYGPVKKPFILRTELTNSILGRLCWHNRRYILF
jgi:hypothetical protein